MISPSISPATHDVDAGDDQVSQQARLNAATSTTTRRRRRKRSPGRLVFTSVSIVMAVLMSIFVWSLVFEKTAEYKPGAVVIEPEPAQQPSSQNTDPGSPRIVSRATP